ncbi:serine hydrolase domain-containing protein [Paractinoplanes brasiliensis]|uniref:CubicO group peptidase (Beta-lactamase class C family) n=1 Tax=Paractinoplanes brasiliensis TaxID=52695 RepID=A0A4R6JRM6_9ACTN|nr:serine hydrolase domain-containing protein [Actinoplanes brasiliensis]TDO39303.1 CubicO group peptidase (beta-lactamase class C family) [Actinoplanes brasiliensis]
MDGLIAPGFEAVGEAFATDPRGGSALTILRAGEPVVELVEGWRDAARTEPWKTDTLVNVYSTGKPVIAMTVVLLAGRGVIDLDAPMATYWPGFRTPASVRQVLSHTSGLASFPVPRPASAFADWDLLCADLAAAEPEWAPGTVAAEHALTYGHLLGELVRRVDGRTPARFVADELGFDFGFALSDADIARCAELEFDRPDWPERNAGEPGSVKSRAISNPAGARDLAVVNSDLWRRASIPAVNLHAGATGVARFYAAILDGSLPAVAVPQFVGPDLFIGEETTWGLGVQIEPDGTWGHGGLGGSAGYADPARNLAIAYVTRRLGDFAALDRIDAALPR